MRVQCEKCKAEYNIDEARVPSEGLQIKCPRCMSTFIVSKEGSMPDTSGDLFDLGDSAPPGGNGDSLELDLPEEPGMPGLPPTGVESTLPPIGGGSTLPPIEHTVQDSPFNIPPPESFPTGIGQGSLPNVPSPAPSTFSLF